MTLLSVRDLTVSYPVRGPLAGWWTGQKRFVDVVCGISLDLAEGTTLAIAGESGSGKSTFARALMGLTPFRSGSLIFDGKAPFPARGRPARAYLHQVSMMFQDPVASLSPRRTIGALITEPFRIHRPDLRNLEAEAKRLLVLVGLPADFAQRYPHQISGGQARRVGLARAVALNPRLVIADEPTAGLDVSVQGEILNLMARLQAEQSVAFLMITHNLAVVRHMSDRTAIMYMGRIVEEGPTDRVFASPAHPYAAALIAAEPSSLPGHHRHSAALKGEVSSPLHRPDGCAFHPRCPAARPLCSATAPLPQVSASGALVSCHFPLQRTPDQ